MTYDTEKKVLGREPVTIVEVDLDYCSLTFGVAPCTASIPTTGSQKCFNTRRTCQDPANYARSTKTYRFSDRELPVGAPASIPSLLNVSTLPTKIDPGKSLGARSKVTITFQDGTMADRGIDKYVAERTYNSATQGTYWGKLIARNPFYQSRPIRVMTGYITDGVYDAANFKTKNYLIEKISGPDSSGKVTLTAKDILKLVADDRAQTPLPSNGTLLSDISTGATTATLTPAGIGNSEYPASGVARIGDEVVTFTRSSDVLTMDRAQRNTAAQTHSSGDTVQLCTEYTDMLAHEIIYDLLTVKGIVPTSYIDFAAWEEEVETWISSQRLFALITKPTGITELLDELAEQSLTYIWWDEIEQNIPLRVLRPSRTDEITELSDAFNIVKDSLTVSDDPSKRLSEVWVFYGQRDPTQELDKTANYQKSYVLVDTDAESANEYGEKRIKVIYSRWLPADNPASAILLAARLLARYRNNPRLVKFQLDAKDSDVWTGDVVRVSSRQLQDITGAPEELLLQVLSSQENKTGTLFAYELVDSFFRGRYAYITPDDAPDYFDATDEEKDELGFICEDTGLFSDGSEGYKII